ncbi:MAG: hypothetical protein ABJH01_09665 [Algoriphagus sp.]
MDSEFKLNFPKARKYSLIRKDKDLVWVGLKKGSALSYTSFEFNR